MSTYVVRRLIGAVTVLFGLVAFAFLATHFIGDPIAFMADPDYTTPEEREQLRIAGGYDRPVWEQFGDFLGGAVPLAVYSARRSGKASNMVVTGVTTFLASVPGFFFALLFISVFAVQLGWVPTSGYGWWPEMVLPVAALALGSIGRYTQVLEQAIRTELNRDYVRTARSKGLDEAVISRRHVLRNAGLVGLTLIGAEMVLLFNGAVIVEQIFAWPGVGQVLLDAVAGRDLPVVMAGVIYIGVIVVVVNLLVELLYASIDPRVRLR